MKLTRPIAVIGAALVLAAGAAVAVQASGPDTVRLCVPRTVGVVTVADSCPSGSRAVRVPTKAAVDLLTERVAALEPHLDLTYTAPSGEGVNRDRDFRVVGRNLQPGAIPLVGPGGTVLVIHVSEFGRTDLSGNILCVTLPASAELRGENGEHFAVDIPAC